MISYIKKLFLISTLLINFPIFCGDKYDKKDEKENHEKQVIEIINLFKKDLKDSSEEIQKLLFDTSIAIENNSNEEVSCLEQALNKLEINNIDKQIVLYLENIEELNKRKEQYSGLDLKYLELEKQLSEGKLTEEEKEKILKEINAIQEKLKEKEQLLIEIKSITETINELNSSHN